MKPSTLAKKLLIFSLVLSCQSKVNADVSLEIIEDESKFGSLSHQSIEKIGIGNSLFIRSNIPVSVLQYRHNFHDFDRLVYPGQAVVIVKSECKDDSTLKEFDPNVVVDTFRPRMSTESVLFLNANTPRNHENDEMLPASSFQAEWDSYNRQCNIFEPIEETVEEPQPPPVITESKGDGLEAEKGRFNFVGEVSDMIFSNLRPRRENKFDDEDSTINPGSQLSLVNAIQNFREESTDSGCSITAEVLYDSCAHSLSISAPSIQIYEHKDVVDETFRPDPDQQCNLIKNGILKFQGDPIIANITKSSYTVGQSNPGMCSQVVVGRPFLDDEGQIIQAEAEIVPTSDWAIDDIAEKVQSEEVIQREVPPSYAADWTNRALGEHASIASFAAFTIALMTNNAPASLIEDALLAALDELRHARTSFDMASLLSKQVIAPTELPSTTHNFEHDLESLALAAAREGCIDETISALLAAAEVQQLSNEDSNSLPFSWKEKVEIIATEEAKHSALAWRTIHWACSKDSDVCMKVMRFLYDQQGLEHFNTADLDEQIAKSLDRNFMKVINNLMPLVSNAVNEIEIYGTHDDDFIGEIADLMITNVISALKSVSVMIPTDLSSIESE